MLSHWIAVEHYRLHLVERWPDSPHKDATLAAIYSTLAALGQNSLLTTASRECVICSAKRLAVVVYPTALRVAPAKSDSARSHPYLTRVARAGAASD
jgi:hypothetical protein